MKENIALLKIIGNSMWTFQETRMAFENKIGAAIRDDTITNEQANQLNTFRKSAKKIEDDLQKSAKKCLEDFPIFTTFLTKIKGCAERSSVAVITEIGDITRFPNVSCLWSYSGFRVDENGKAVRREKGQKCNWNAFLKMRLYILADTLMKLNYQGNKPLRYRKRYDDLRHRYEHRKECHLTKIEHAKSKTSKATWLKNGCTKGHVHNMALRGIQKLFLMDLFFAWYELLGITPPSTYAEDKLGRVHRDQKGPNLTPKRSKKLVKK